MNLFDIAGEEYYFDLETIADFVRLDSTNTKNGLDYLLTKKEESEEPIVENKELDEEMLQGPLIDMTKWDLTKAMVETILSENGIVDEAMGVTKLGEQLSIPFRLSFNTLVRHKIIKTNKK
tara:strand:+ start:484 stop:846 length:363 start_codon:yes stop_codon:yes gene_type:complete